MEKELKNHRPKDINKLAKFIVDLSTDEITQDEKLKSELAKKPATAPKSKKSKK